MGEYPQERKSRKKGLVIVIVITHTDILWARCALPVAFSTKAALRNMSGVHEHDFPPGCDIVGQGPKATAERMDFELFNRLMADFDLSRGEVV